MPIFFHIKDKLDVGSFDWRFDLRIRLNLLIFMTFLNEKFWGYGVKKYLEKQGSNQTKYLYVALYFSCSIRKKIWYSLLQENDYD